MESIRFVYNFIVDVAEHGPLGVHAFFVGLMVSWGAAYVLRWWHPRTLPVNTRDMWVGLVQLVLGWGVVYAFWTTAWGLALGFINGAFAPFLWNIVLGVADWKFPGLARAMRGQRRRDDDEPDREPVHVPPPNGQSVL